MYFECNCPDRLPTEHTPGHSYLFTMISQWNPLCVGDAGPCRAIPAKNLIHTFPGFRSAGITVRGEGDAWVITSLFPAPRTGNLCAITPSERPASNEISPQKKAIGVTRVPGGASPVFPVRVGSVLSAISHGEDHGRSPSGDRRRVEAIQQQAQFPPAHRGRLEMRGLRARCRGIGFHAPRIPHPSNDRNMPEAHARGVCQGTAYGVSRPEKMGPFL